MNNKKLKREVKTLKKKVQRLEIAEEMHSNEINELCRPRLRSRHTIFTRSNVRDALLVGIVVAELTCSIIVIAQYLTYGHL